MLNSKRYHSLDAMRGVLMIMGVYFHLAIPYAESGAHILWPFIALTHAFRMHAFFFISGFFGALILYRKGSKEMLQNRFKRVFLPLIVLAPPVCFLSAIGSKYVQSIMNTDKSFMDGLAKVFDSPLEYSLYGTEHLWFLHLLFAMSILGYIMSKGLELNVDILKRLFGSLFKNSWLGFLVVCFLYAFLLSLLNIHKAQTGKIYDWFWFVHPSALKGFVAFSFFYFWGWQAYHFKDQLGNISLRTYFKIYVAYAVVVWLLVWSLFQTGYSSPYWYWNDFFHENISAKKVTFIVDMSDEVVIKGDGDSSAVYVNVSPWEKPQGFKMDPIGNGQWSYTMELWPGAYSYKFRNGLYNDWSDAGWEDWERIGDGGCGYGKDNNRRFFLDDEDLTLGIFCWSECMDCSDNEVPLAFYQNNPLETKNNLIRRCFIFLNNFAVPMWIMLTMAFFVRFYYKFSKTLKYISDSSYWIYIIHPILIPFIGSVFYYDKINVHIQFFLSSILLTIACFLSYHYLVRKTFIGKFLNGKKVQ